ncbi:DUF2339 domain-containing protein, partial [Thiococcus pfennigii]|uniref:DUF2339 domain-containing protein n=1 Tax=Thiococcus pfennigii TaxID=1057 RepID=UPI001905143F
FAAAPFVPLANPLELAQFAALWLLWQVAAGAPLRRRGALERWVLALGLLVITAATLRGVHQFAGLPWSVGLWDERLVQAALAIVWTALGIGAMLFGARRGRRPLWVGGAALAGVVIVKLLLVDRHYLGDLPGIVAFLGVGLLLVAVGYFAPVPPAGRADPSD